RRGRCVHLALNCEPEGDECVRESTGPPDERALLALRFQGSHPSYSLQYADDEFGFYPVTTLPRAGVNSRVGVTPAIDKTDSACSAGFSDAFRPRCINYRRASTEFALHKDR